MDIVINLIQTIGFPFAACVFLAYYIKTQNEQYREDVKRINEEYREDVKEITDKYETAINKFSASIDKNTGVLTSLEENLKEYRKEKEA